MKLGQKAAAWLVLGAAIFSACGDGATTTTSAPLITSAPSASTTTTLQVAEAKALVESQYEGLIGTAEEVRGLAFSRPPTLVFVDDDEMETRVIPGTLRVELLDGMGFGSVGPTGHIVQYQVDRNRIAVLTPRTELTPFARAELIGELVLALTYEHFPAVGELDDEGNIGLLGLRLGDAAFHRDAYVDGYLTSTERFALQLESVRQSEKELILPGFVRTFEQIGDEVAQVLVKDLIAQGGVAGLNEAYERPPLTAEQLFHPESYRLNIQPVAVSLPETVGCGMLPGESGTMGELWIRSFFNDSLSEAEMLQATTGWAGDTYTVWTRREDLALSSLFVMDSRQDAIELRDGLSHWALNAFALAAGRSDHKGVVFEGDGYVYVAQVDDEVLFVASPDRTLGEKVREQFWPRY